MSDTQRYEQIAAGLGELHKKLTRMQSRTLEAYQISLAEYHILVVIQRMQKVSQNDLAAALNVDKALISRQIQSMESKGLLCTDYDPECRRKKVLTLTDKTRELIPKLETVHRSSLERFFDGMEEQQLVQLQEILEGLANKL